MTKDTAYSAGAAMLIRKPVSEVFEAFIDPEITSKFWFTKSSGKLETGKKVEWVWEMYHQTVPVTVETIIPNEKIVIRWGNYQQESTVQWTFQSLGDSKTFVSIINNDFKGTPEELIAQVRDSTEGFTWVLAGVKVYLEHHIEPHFIIDKFPKELAEH